MSKSKKAFTIIEVVLVLAVSGLLFIMVFIAFPALKNGQKRIQREDDLSRIAGLAITYRADHGNLSPFRSPDAALDFVEKYLDDGCVGHGKISGNKVSFSSCGAHFSDPDGSPYGFEIFGELEGDLGEVIEIDSDSFSGNMESHLMRVYEKAACGGGEFRVRVSENMSDFAIIYVEPTGVSFCYDNQ